MNNKDQHLEDMFKEALENHEMPFDASEWDKLEAKLDQKMPVQPKSNLNKWLVGGGIAAAIILGVVAIYNLDNDVDNNNQNNDTPIASNEQKLNDSNDNPQDNLETIESSNLDSNEEKDKSVSSSEKPNELTNNKSNENNSPNKEKEDELKKINSLDNPTLTSKDTEGEKIDMDHYLDNDKEDQVKTDLPTPELTLLSSGEICQGENIHAEVKNHDKYRTIEWYFNDQMIGKEKEVQFTPHNDGTGELTVIASSQKDSKTTTEVIEIKLNPAPEIEWKQPDPSVSEVELSHSLTGVNSKWYVNGELSEKTYESTVKIPFQDKGSYQVKLEVEQANGCKNAAEENIFIIDDFKLLAPNTFTPNGDNVNDDFIPRSLEVMNKEFVMVIYDRNGKVIYQTQSIHEPWNGTIFNSGKPAPEGSYVWTVRFKEDQQTYQGVISLMR